MNKSTIIIVTCLIISTIGIVYNGRMYADACQAIVNDKNIQPSVDRLHVVYDHGVNYYVSSELCSNYHWYGDLMGLSIGSFFALIAAGALMQYRVATGEPINNGTSDAKTKK